MDNIQEKTYGKIYRLTNKINGKMYHGQTIQDLKDRWIKYRSLDCENQPKIYRALLKYGPESFIYECVDIAKEQSELNKLETFYIRKFDSMHNGYNCNEGGDSPGAICEETKRKISEANKGCKNGMFGKLHSIETKHKMSIANKNNNFRLGKKATEEFKNNLSAARKGILNPMFGRTLSKETRNKISKAKTGSKYNTPKKANNV